MILVCITGILGSGKSTVTALLRKRGLDVLDLDAIARDSLNWKEPRDDIRDAFGAQYVVGDKVDIERLKGTFFSKENVRALEAIVHPRIRQEVRRRLAALEAKGTPLGFIDHPLLFETGFHRRFDAIVVVTADMKTVRERLGKRGMDPEDMDRRLTFHIPLKVKEKMADYVIDNSGTENQLEEQVEALLEKITKREVS
jgi:dephospho-CoA kinase